MDQQPTARPSELPPPYGISMNTSDMASSEHDQAQEAKTKTDFIQLNGLTNREIFCEYARLPNSLFSASPPPVVSYSDELSYPNALIKKGNVIYPAHNQTLPLYYLPEATYWSDESGSPSPRTCIFKRHGTFHDEYTKYTTIKTEPECYTAFASFCHIYTRGWKHLWRLEGIATGDLRVELRVNGTLWDSRYALSIRDLRCSKPVVIKRSVQSEITSEKGWLKTHSWSDTTTNKALAWESGTAPGAPPSDSVISQSLGDQYRFEFNKAVGKELRSVLTAAWCISLWVDAETARRDVVESRNKSKGTLGRLARLWQSEEGSADSLPEPNELREMLGLDEPTIPEPPREMMWYEPREKSTLGATLQSFF